MSRLLHRDWFRVAALAIIGCLVFNQVGLAATGAFPIALPNGQTAQVSQAQIDALSKAPGITKTTTAPTLAGNQVAVAVPEELGGGYLVGTPEALASGMNAAGITIGATAAMFPMIGVLSLAAVLGVVVGVVVAVTGDSSSATTSHHATTAHH
jgi:hypothetical protein